MSGVEWVVIDHAILMDNAEQRVNRARAEEVALSAYDPEWPRLFAAEAQHLRACLPDGLIGRIEHFGSTAVPGLAAKPIVDMLIEVPSLLEVHRSIAPELQRQGYEYFWRPSWRDGITPEYTWFIKRNRLGQRTHHLHMLERGSPDWERLMFRDYLILHPEIAREYEALKCRIAAQSPNDRIAYAKEKTRFITEITRDASAYYAAHSPHPEGQNHSQGENSSPKT